MLNKFDTLTEIEIQGLQSECNMADGHAYHDLSLKQNAIICRLSEIWQRSNKIKHRHMEYNFRDVFLDLAESASLHSYEHFRICPTASNSIDLIAAWLKEKELRVGLIEPTFDNLALILRRRGCSLSSVSEALFDEQDFDEVIAKSGVNDVDAIFLVNPNNPSGKVMTAERFKEFVFWCAIHQKIILLDNTFRFFVNQDFDQFEILLNSKVTFFTIEDTGKVWPTQDMKVSTVFFSEDVAREFNIIYEEIYLCVSNFQLEILCEFLRSAKQQGLERSVWAEVQQRREQFRKVIAESVLSIMPGSEESKISVEWVKICDGFINDIELMTLLKQSELIVLPGRYFYWKTHGPSLPINSVRFSLLKSRVQFLRSLDILAYALERIRHTYKHDQYQDVLILPFSGKD